MKIGVVVLTHYPTRNNRVQLLADCVESLVLADRVVVNVNGATDEDLEAINGLGVESWVAPVGTDVTSGAGTFRSARIGVGLNCDLVVLSDDDMWWRPGWADRLERWWTYPQPNCWLTGCHLEPEYQWNAISGLPAGPQGVRGVRRASSGSASWSFPSRVWPDLSRAFAANPTDQQGWWDVPTCRAVYEYGGSVWQIDLAEHRGVSTWGNASSQFSEVGRVRDLVS